jgi:tetratricopeptide (TPR) repeat protein
MFGCRKMRGLIAASVYEDLPEADRRALDRHLDACPGCRAEAAALARTSHLVPRTSPDPGFDLLPRLKARLAEREAPRRAPAWRWAAAAASFAVVMACLYAVAPRSARPESPALTAVASARAHADELVKTGNYTGAYDLLSQAVAQHPDDPSAASAQMALADLAFDRHWYDRADAAYRDLMTRYYDAVDRAPQADRARTLLRWNMLDEGRKSQYALLQQMDRARGSRDGAFALYEDVVAKAPDSTVAQEAVREMLALAAPDTAVGSPEGVVTAMQAAREKCKHPIAVARLDLEIGLTAWRDLNNLDLAKEALGKVENSSEPVLAQRARQALMDIRAQNPS